MAQPETDDHPVADDLREEDLAKIDAGTPRRPLTAPRRITLQTDSGEIL